MEFKIFVLFNEYSNFLDIKVYEKMVRASLF